MDKLKMAREEIDRVDREMAALFCRRMETVHEIAAYKQARSLPVSDLGREAEILSRNTHLVREDLQALYAEFQQSVMDISKQYQKQLTHRANGLRVELGSRSYDIVMERGCLQKASQHLDLNRRVLIVTDDGVPAQYAEALAAQCKEACIITVPQGEQSKSLAALDNLLERMNAFDMDRRDCVAAVGGGMVGDLAGLAASLYMRGVDFCNIPTTLLSQVDSSVGGKTAVNYGGVKNTVGTFYQPRRVLLDTDLLATLPHRHLAVGLAESLKMAATLDSDLFATLEQDDPITHLDEIIARSVSIKARVVAADETERGLRRVLNFGHTIGHAIESTHPELLHGECVALGMLPMCAGTVRQHMLPIYEKLGLPTTCQLDIDDTVERMTHDKKRIGTDLLVVEVPEIGQFTIRPTTVEELRGRLSQITRGADKP